jgi:hypothetical protein
MATSTLIQYLETEQKDGFGASVAVGPATMDRRQTETFLAADAITAGDVVSLDAGQAADGDKAIKVKRADSGDTNLVCPVGVALASAASGEKVEVCVRGVCEANVAAHTKGDVLTVTATAGRLDTIAAATSPAVGVSLDGAGAPGLATIFVRGAF